MNKKPKCESANRQSLICKNANKRQADFRRKKDKNHLIPAYMLGAVLNQHVPGGVIKKVWMDISGEPCKPTDQNLKLLQSQYQLVWLK